MLDAKTGFPLQSMVASLHADARAASESVNIDGAGTTLSGDTGRSYDLTLVLTELRAISPDFNSLQALLTARSTNGGTQAWQWRTDYSDLKSLREASGTFRDTIGSAQNAKTLLDNAVDFSRTIFDPDPQSGISGDLVADRNVENARLARQAIVDRAAYPAGRVPPSMVVQIVGGNAEGRAAYSSAVMPIAALALSPDNGGPPIFLGERFALSLVLTGQQPDRQLACPRNWYMAVPGGDMDDAGGLKTALDNMKALIAELPVNAVRRQSASLSELRAWFQGDPPAMTPAPFVMAYLGHHDKGQLYLQQKAGGLIAGAIRRNFGGSSIAILDACETAMDSINDGMPVGRLARQHVAATVMTTSSIDGNLAAAYLQCMNAVLARKQGLTIGEAHALTTQCLWDDQQGERYGQRYNMGASALKFMLVGNQSQKICAPERTATP